MIGFEKDECEEKNQRIKISQLQNKQTQKQALFLIIENNLERKEHQGTKINHD